MAEINIQRKRKPIWIWVFLVLVILIALTIWYWTGSDQDMGTRVNTTSYRQAFSIEETVILKPTEQLILV